MLKKLLLLLLLFAGLLTAQSYRVYDTRYVFYTHYGKATSTLPQDSIYSPSGYSYMLVHGDTLPDTLISGAFSNDGGGGDITIYAGIDSISDTTNAVISFGYYVGPEYGWVWIPADTLTTDNQLCEWTLADESGFNTQILDVWAIKIHEIGNQRNNIWIRIKKFLWN